MNKILTILCEGPHDVSFLTKLLKSIEFRSHDKTKIQNFPQPFKDLIINSVKETNIEELNIQEIRSTFIPSDILIKDNSFVFLYSMGGDTRKDIRSKFINSLLDLIPEKGEISPYDEFEVSIFLLLDADDKGVESRLDTINSELEEIFDERPFDKENSSKTIQGMKLGFSIFTKVNENYGKLEDIILPLMKQNNEEIFDSAEEFFDKYFSEERCKKKYDKSKSVICISGQLQKSGASNVVCIAQTDYLDSEKIRNDKSCQKIIEEINKFIAE